MMDSMELIGQSAEDVVPQLTIEEETEDYARLIAEPLASGYGITLGNALRRVLLSSLEGAAITSVRIDQVQHEFSTIAGMQEDTTEFLLNVKEIRLRALSDDTNSKSGYSVIGNEIRAEVSETDQGNALAAFLARTNTGNFAIRQSSLATPWYLSVFVCAGPGGAVRQSLEVGRSLYDSARQ